MRMAGEMMFDCNECGIRKKNMIEHYDYDYNLMYVLCKDCEQKRNEAIREHYQLLQKKIDWLEDATCPSCEGKFRKQGEIEQSKAKTIINSLRQIHHIVTFFDFATYMKRSFIHMGKFIVSMIKDEEVATFRQCSECNELAIKCPECSNVFIPKGKPNYWDELKAKCPICGQNIYAFKEYSYFSESG